MKYYEEFSCWSFIAGKVAAPEQSWDVSKISAEYCHRQKKGEKKWVMTHDAQMDDWGSRTHWSLSWVHRPRRKAAYLVSFVQLVLNILLDGLQKDFFYVLVRLQAVRNAVNRRMQTGYSVECAASGLSFRHMVNFGNTILGPASI